MKRLVSSALMLILLSAPAFAAKNSETLNLGQSSMLGTTQLPAADYKVTWTGTGNSGQVTLTHGKTTVTVPAKIVDQKNNANSVLTDSKDGTTTIKAINLNKVSLIFEAAPSSGQ